MTLATCAAVLLVACTPSGVRGEAAAISLQPGEFYFRVSGTQRFLLGRNPTGWRVEQFTPLLQWSRGSGEGIARTHLTVGMEPNATPGEVDEEWARRWDRVFDLAAENGVYVLPVFGVWGDWNDGSKGERWHYWHRNQYNAALGGPAESPADLLKDTDCQRLWLRWLDALVRRWARRGNILGWEIFSELDLITGSSEAAAAGLVERAGQVIRAADPLSRPVTASLAGTNEWPTLFGSSALDFIQVHPYGADLSDRIITSVRERIVRYGKPVFIGECGLSAAPPGNPLTSAPRAPIGIKHGIWASVVSGAMNGRMLWWEDGYDQYERRDLRTQYKDVAAPVARFVEGIDFAGMTPIEVSEAEGLKGAAIGHERLVLGWFRDELCAAPEWPVRRVERAKVRLRVPGGEKRWRADFCDTGSGQVVSRPVVNRDGTVVVVPLPALNDSIAFRLTVLQR